MTTTITLVQGAAHTPYDDDPDLGRTAWERTTPRLCAARRDRHTAWSASSAGSCS
jgi:hypothetical protein